MFYVEATTDRETPQRLAAHLLIAQECPEQVTRDQLKKTVCTWYDVKLRRIQLPVRDSDNC